MKLKRYVFQAVVGVIVLLGTLAGPIAFSSPAAGSQADGSFSGATFVIQQAGPIGNYYLPEPPGFEPIWCEFNEGADQVTLHQPGGPSVQARADHPNTTQVVTFKRRLYQRLANGSLDLVLESNEGSVLANKTGLTTYNGLATDWHLPAGPDWVLTYLITWKKPDATVAGWVLAGYSTYKRTVQVNGLPQSHPNATACVRPLPPEGSIIPATGTVNSILAWSVDYFPISVPVAITWDTTSIGTVTSDDDFGYAQGYFKVPASPMGNHTVRFKYGHWEVAKTYTVKPRIKLIPSTVARDQSVNVSLRGFKKQEVVRIRWKKGASWVQLAQVTTSNTGSANINIKVPTWAPDGQALVRGDSVNASGGHAQTSQVTVSGGPFVSSQLKTPTPTPTSTPQPSATPTVLMPTETTTMPTETPIVLMPTETPAVEATATLDETPTVLPEASPVAVLS